MQSKRKEQKKIRKLKKNFLLVLILVGSCCAIGFSLWQPKEEIYQLKSRIENITKEKKEDTSDYKTIGWLRVQGTNIDTPIIGFVGDSFRTRVEKMDYLWNTTAEEILYNKVNIMGHNILNLSKNPEIGLDYFQRFDDLMSFVYLSFAEENKYIQYTVDGKDYLYKIFAVNFEKSYNLNLSKEGNYTKKELKKYIKEVKEDSLFEFDVDVNETDNIISLITCTRMFGAEDTSTEFIVNARMVRKNEKLYNYSVKETNNYEKIKKIMKGDEVDEEA